MTFNELIDQINTMLSEFGAQVGNDIVGKNSTGDAKFNNPGGTWGDNPTTPLTTSTINLSLTGALNAGTSCVYYKGNVLTKDSFIGGDVVFFSGSNRLDVLCAIWITYDKGSGSFHVNIQDTWTGDLPEQPTDIENAPTNLVLTLEDSGGDIENAPSNLILTEEEITVTENPPTNLVLTEEEI